nr:nitrogen assimilation transcription factor nira [Quercus suber]
MELHRNVLVNWEMLKGTKARTASDVDNLLISLCARPCELHPNAKISLSTTMPRAVSGRSARTGYGLTCSKCRSRKIKCDGRRPECGICVAYGERCHYDRLPSMSQVLGMANRIEDLERQLAQRPVDTGSTASAAIDTAPTTVAATVSTSSFTPAQSMSIENLGSSNAPQVPQYQSTSAVDEPIADTDETTTVSASTLSVSYTMTEQEILYWEDAALQACASMVFLSQERLSHLFRTHWTWVHPTFLFIPRPYFLRAASCGEEHFSTLLLNVICLHSTRFTDHYLSDVLLSRVRLLLGQELHKGPCVPTVQALLQLSAREIGQGARSQAWLYSGIAFRSAIDLGCFSKCTSASIPPADRMIKEQLAWSCYLWDKAISLYLGRSPVLLEKPAFDPPTLDPAAEVMAWSCYPNGGTKAASSSLTSHTMSCFANFCRLAPIVNDILLNIYAKKSPTDAASLLRQMKQRLDIWRSESPDYLRVDRTTPACPPPHILAQNNGSCLAVCRESAEEVERLFLLLENSFGLEHVTYLMAYCAYTAATVAVMDGSQTRINTYLRALFAIRSSCPGIQRSIDLIIKGFGTASKNPSRPKSHSPEPEIMQQQDPLPAFPFDQIHEQNYGTTGDMDSIPFGNLGPFPFEWSTIANDEFDIAP